MPRLLSTLINKFLFNGCALLILASLANSISCSAQEMLWGVTSEGGEYGKGAIFKVNADGSGLEVKKSFYAISGRTPLSNKLIQAPNGKFYGMTYQGGSHLKGVLFEFNPSNNAYRKIIDFDGDNGGYPYGGLVLSSNGKLYGMTSNGGEYDKGVLFEYNYTIDSFTKKIDFQGSSNGALPYSDLVQANDGNLYGVTFEGGTNNFGTIFQYDPVDNVLTKKIDFNGTTGKKPFGSMIVSTSGKLYGMASDGGNFLKGTIFEYDIDDNTILKRADFSGTSTGASPSGNLLEATDGLLYGMTFGGGSTGQGILFSFDPVDGKLEAKINFNGTNGQAPYGSLMQATNGKLYGVTEQGIAGHGGLFEFDMATGLLKNKVTFDGLFAGSGSTSRTTLLQALDGKLYGMNSIGGIYMDGILFSYDPTSENFQVRLSFGGGLDGDWPLGGLAQGANGKLYGTTYYGGIDRAGVLFEYDISKDRFSKKLDFNFSDGAHPYSGMILASNNKLYGVTRFGGTLNSGVLFEFDPSSSQYSKKIDFDTEFGIPIGSLFQTPNGKIYGLTENGGLFNMGTLFEFDPLSNAFVKKIDFDGTDKGSSPTGGFVYANDKLYGLTHRGGIHDNGVLFTFDLITNSFIKLLDFDGVVSGTNPIGSMVKAQNDKFYGVTQRGGSNNWGVIFEYDPLDEIFTKKFNFTGIHSEGVDIQSGLIESFNGKLYGTTNQGGTSNFGVLYEYDLIENTVVKKEDFIGINGARPYSALLPVSLSDQTITFDPVLEKTSLDDPFLITASSSSGLPVTFTISNSNIATVNGGTVTIKNGGTTAIKASQAGNINFHPAPDVLQPLVVILIISIEDDLSNPQPTAYPNPTKDEFFLELNGNKTWKELVVHDQLGRTSTVPVEKIEGNMYRGVTHSLASGVYSITLPESKQSIRIIIIK